MNLKSLNSISRKNLKKRLIRLPLVWLCLLLVPAIIAVTTNAAQPTYDTATVDGNIDEWNLANDSRNTLCPFKGR